MKLSIKDFSSKSDQIRSFLRIWSHLMKKSFMENFIFCAVTTGKYCERVKTHLFTIKIPIKHRFLQLKSPYQKLAYRKKLPLFKILKDVIIGTVTAEKMKFSVKDFFSICDQIRGKLRIWSYLLKKCLMESFIFCAVRMHITF